MLEFDDLVLEELRGEHGVTLLRDDSLEQSAVRLGEGRTAIVYDAVQEDHSENSGEGQRSVALHASTYFRGDEDGMQFQEKELSSLTEAKRILNVLRILGGPWLINGKSLPIS